MLYYVNNSGLGLGNGCTHTSCVKKKKRPTKSKRSALTGSTCKLLSGRWLLEDSRHRRSSDIHAGRVLLRVLYYLRYGESRTGARLFNVRNN